MTVFYSMPNCYIINSLKSTNHTSNSLVLQFQLAANSILMHFAAFRTGLQHKYRTGTCLQIVFYSILQIFCVLNMYYFQAGYDYDEETFEKVFRRIYSTFGSGAPYTVFSDSQPFLRWARKKGVLVGLVSNAEYRYRDVILPALGLHQVNMHG